MYTYIKQHGPKIGFSGATFAGNALGGLLWHILASRKKLAIEAISQRLSLDEKSAHTMARKSFAHNCRSFFELLLIPKVNNAFVQNRITIANPQNFMRMQTYNGPVVATAAHLGAWELLNGMFGTAMSQEHRITVVRRHKNPNIHDLITHFRESRGVTILDHRDAAFSIMKTLKRKGVAGFLVDHNCRRNEAIFLPFLGKIAAVNMGPAVMAVRTKAAVFPVNIIRDGKGGYIFTTDDPLLPEEFSGSREEKIRQVAEFYTQAVEKMVTNYPEQWFWMHKRWKTQPEPEN